MDVCCQVSHVKDAWRAAGRRDVRATGWLRDVRRSARDHDRHRGECLISSIQVSTCDAPPSSGHDIGAASLIGGFEESIISH